MEHFNSLVERDKQSRKKIAVIGDSMQDIWIHGHSTSSQEGCPKFVEEERIHVPGGAANAARSLVNWNVDVFLIAPWPTSGCGEKGRRGQVDISFAHPPFVMPVKKRFVNGFHRTEFRHDIDPVGYGLRNPDLIEIRELTIKAVRNFDFDAVLIADYAKGFVDEAMIRQLCVVCRDKGIPCVVDAKRSPKCCESAVLKCNDEFLFKWRDACNWHAPAVVLTLGADYPLVFNESKPLKEVDDVNLHGRHEPCVNHVGAGDCFAAHLALALAHGIELMPAVLIAHAAGQVYVQHPHNRPPWPHEIRKQLDPVGGKELQGSHCLALRQSEPGRIIFTNGVFRLPHAGHAWLFNWCKKTGDTVVVGINDDESAMFVKPGKFLLPLRERIAILASMASVDWIIPFAESDPCAILRELKPDVLVKGHEYEGQRVPGDDIVENVQFAPPDAFQSHTSDIAIAILEGR